MRSVDIQKQTHAKMHKNRSILCVEPVTIAPPWNLTPTGYIILYFASVNSIGVELSV